MDSKTKPSVPAPAVATNSERQNNYPPFTCIPGFKPCFYQDIDEEIDIRHRPIVRLAYYDWITTGVYFLVELIAAIACWAASGNVFVAMLIFVFAIGHILVLFPLNYILWFRPLYSAFARTGSPRLNFFVFFGTSLFAMVSLTIQALGIPGYTPGLVNGSQFIASGVTSHVIAGIIMLISGLFAAVLIIPQIYLFVKMIRIYKESGRNLQEQARSSGRDMVYTVQETGREMRL